MRAALDEAGVSFEAKHRLGLPGETIAKEAQEQSCDMIVMGTKGAGAAGALLGSVAQDTIENSAIPVLLVK